jgi:hypothetical protein
MGIYVYIDGFGKMVMVVRTWSTLKAVQGPQGPLLGTRVDMDLQCGGPCGNNDTVLLESSLCERVPRKGVNVPRSLVNLSRGSQSKDRGCGDAFVSYAPIHWGPVRMAIELLQKRVNG